MAASPHREVRCLAQVRFLRCLHPGLILLQLLRGLGWWPSGAVQKWTSGEKVFETQVFEAW